MKNILLLFLTLYTIFFYSCRQTRTPVAFELPKDYTGWVTIKYEKPKAPPLETIDGHYKIKVSDSGFAETSSNIEEGWAEDRFFWIDEGKEHIIPKYTNGNKSMIHSEIFKNADYLNFVNPDTVPIDQEITLFDGSKLTKLDDKGGLSLKSGRYFMYIFYVSSKPEDIWDFPNNNLPPIPPEHERW